MTKQDIEILKKLKGRAKERDLGIDSINYYYALKHAIEEKETPTAHWVGQCYAQCSNCDKDVPSFLFESEWKQIKTPFCPNCGSKMENPEENDDDYKYDAYDYCYECSGLGDDYIINENGELESYCDRCGCNPDLIDDDDD